MAHGGSNDLQTVAQLLASGQREAMRQLYLLTSRSLYGKLMGQLADENLAQTALKATYLRIWKDRTAFAAFEGREFQLIAAIAHQCALDIRFRTVLDGYGLDVKPSEGRSPTSNERTASKANFEERDEALLKAAYLEFAPPDVLARRFEMTPGEVRSKLAFLASGEGGQRDE